MDHTTASTITINKKFCGPPNSGNGGYVCGKLAGRLPGAAEVSLRKPPPLDRPMRIEEQENKVLLFDENTLIAEARPAQLVMDLPSPPGPSTAALASKAYAGFDKHYFPTCFVCGTERKPGDGLRIFAGATPNGQLVAAPWLPHESLFDGKPELPHEFCWAALDCPGAYAVHEKHQSMKVLGRLTAKITEAIVPGERMIVIGWHLGSEGRKFYSGTALFNEEGAVKAFARAIWIEIPGNSF